MANERVIPTAWLIAYCRTFTDIPFSIELFEEMERARVDAHETIPDAIKDSRLAPQFEARYKLVNRLIKESQINQVLEIATGLAPRGIDLSSDNNLIYVETDFSKLIEEKKMMLHNISQNMKMKLPLNLHFESANALDFNELLQSCKHFDRSKPIIIVHEGLLRYLSFDEKTIVAQNIHKLLDIFGGAWITPDISKKRIVQDSKIVAHGLRDELNKITGINIDNNLFDDEQHAVTFFEALGFEIERHSFMEAKNNLVSPSKLNIEEKIVIKMLENAQVFIMRVSNESQCN
jgi:O-methyltransferase involved in polyketide biosynthesis